MTLWLSDLWWGRVPRKILHVSPTLATVLSDGVYLTAWPEAAALLPVALLVGFVVGWSHPGLTFTYSIPVMALMLTAGGLGAGPGALVSVAYAVGDFFLFPNLGPGALGRPVSLANLVLPAILSYALLSCLLVFVPLISGGLRHLALVLFIAPTQVGLPIRAALQAGIQSALVWVWTQIVPTLIRPLFTWGGRVPAADWSGKLPPPQAIAPLQHLGWILVCLAALLGALRVALESRAWSHPAVVRGTQQLRAAILEAAGGRKKVRPGWTTSAFKAALITFMLAGLLSSWMEAVVLMAAIVAIMELPSLLRARAAGWFDWVSRVPLVYRLGGGGAFSFAIGAGVAALMWGKTATFLPVLIATLFSLLVFALVVPDQPTAAARRARVHGQAEGGRGVSRSMYGPLISIGAAAVVLLGAREAYADNCGSLIDCYNTVASAGVVAAAIAVAVAIAAIAGPIIVDAAAGIGGEYIAVRARAQRDLGVQEIHSGDLAVHGGAGILKGPDVRLRSGGGGASHSVASEDLLETEERSDHV